MSAGELQEYFDINDSGPVLIKRAGTWQQVPFASPIGLPTSVSILPVARTSNAVCNIFELAAAHKADMFGKNVNPWPAPIATKILLAGATLDHEYLPILGLSEYTAVAAKLILSSNAAALQEKRVVGVQNISGTGVNHPGPDPVKVIWV
ncbi:hypothetical protein P691DRAFT_776363 [Macrolepiota fuliginosa MF-IS2]|uniref:Uncharacterized protein n=1 Tax=Macrolepiota fuliginosa MF-IS2 TaxID=1400762 RepID=A0A9P5XBA1_9AGAR|nr:hypothetical protein P691DRAFT_776363 [Macrolepiota fuliginosa MF-IS2]